MKMYSEIRKEVKKDPYQNCQLIKFAIAALAQLGKAILNQLINLFVRRLLRTSQ